MATSWTWTGVDLFFVLSGFLIGRTLILNKNSANFFSTFYIRRFFRIFPAYYLVLIGYVIFVAFVDVNRFDWLLAGIHPTYSYFLYIQNFFMAFNRFGGHWLGVSWSLAIEEQFYLILPFFVRFFTNNKLLTVILSGLIIAPIVRAIMGPVFNSWLGAYVLLPARMDSLLVGVLVAHLHVNTAFFSILKNYIRSLGLILILLFILILALVVFSDAEIIGGVYNHSLYAIFYGLLIIYVLVRNDNPISIVLSNLFFGLVAKLSYTIYLTHQIFNGFAHHFFAKQDPVINNGNDFLVTTYALLATFIFSFIVYYCMERPFIKLGKRYKY